MPVMSLVEKSFCRSAPWRAFARGRVLPWSLAGASLSGEVLEPGAGSGAYPDIRLTVTDVDQAMVETASHRLSCLAGVTVKQADVTALPFDDGSFDTVTS
jgi:2-polyprenyl-3-methyl-5-hydroxy-6-metoxy-1,4-benzoquinol methylase